MVDALLECWRVLEPGGTLIDIRPFHSNPAIEIITGNEIISSGNVNDEGGLADDTAANEALAAAVHLGLFSLKMQDSFPFAYYWPTLQNMLDYAAEKWRDFAFIPEKTINNLRHCVTTTAGPYQVRVLRGIHLAVYKKTNC